MVVLLLVSLSNRGKMCPSKASLSNHGKMGAFKKAPLVSKRGGALETWRFSHWHLQDALWVCVRKSDTKLLSLWVTQKHTRTPI